VAKGAVKAGHDAIELAAALADANVEDGLARYDAVRRPASAQVVAESCRLGAYIEGQGERADPITFMRENGGSRARTGTMAACSSTSWRRRASADFARFDLHTPIGGRRPRRASFLLTKPEKSSMCFCWMKLAIGRELAARRIGMSRDRRFVQPMTRV
jgi:hypothetical protein